MQAVTWSLSECFLCSWNTVGPLSAETERRRRERGGAGALSSPQRWLVRWPSCAQYGRGRLYRPQAMEEERPGGHSFPKAAGHRGRWDFGLKQEEQQRQRRQEETWWRQGIRVPEEVQGPVGSSGLRGRGSLG